MAQRRLIYISSFSFPSNDFVTLPEPQIVSCIEGDNLRESEISDMMEHFGRRSRLLLRSTLTCRPDSRRAFALPYLAAAFTNLRLLWHFLCVYVCQCGGTRVSGIY